MTDNVCRRPAIIAMSDRDFGSFQATETLPSSIFTLAKLETQMIARLNDT
jgi:hypothetical protein